MSDSKRKALDGVVWEWEDDGKKWRRFDELDIATIEAGYQTGKPMSTTDLSFNKAHGTVYVFDYGNMVQHNTSSNKRRNIRRTAPPKYSPPSPHASYSSTPVGATPAGYSTAYGDTAETDKPDGKAYMSSEMGWISSWDGKSDEKVTSADYGVDDDISPVPPKHASSVSSTATSYSAPSSSHHISAHSATASAPAPDPLAVAASPPPPKKSKAHVALEIPEDEQSRQRALGAQSKRSQVVDYGPAVMKDSHGKACFDEMLNNERKLAGDWAVFYHSYSYAALLYEVQAAVACVLFRFRSQYGSLPRLLKTNFDRIPDAPTLMKLFPKFKTRDHDPVFRSVAISGTSSLLADDSEAPPKSVFLYGYSCSDLSFTGVLENLLCSCGVDKKFAQSLGKEIIKLSEKYGLDVSQFAGKGCKSGKAGHLLQIFVRRSLVDEYVYPALPYGVIDTKRLPLSDHLLGKHMIKGQVRIVMHPSKFLKATCCRMYVYSADPTFHMNRGKFQNELTALLQPIIGDEKSRTKAAAGVFGELPKWYDSKDQGPLARS